MIRGVRGIRGFAVLTSLVLVALVGAAGIAVLAPGASAAQVTRTGLGYTCRFPAGSYLVSVEVTATFKATAAAGGQIQPIRVQLDLRLPSAAIAALGNLPVGAVGSLAVIETGHGKSVRTAWPVLNPQADPASGTLRLTGKAPAITPPGPGLVAFAASNLVVSLARAGGTVRVNCAVYRPARIAAVMVGMPKRAAQPARRIAIPKGCGHIKVTGFGQATCAYLTGYSDVAKLIGAALLQPPSPAKPGLVNVDFAYKFRYTGADVIEKSTAELYYHGRHELPPVTATFLTFRFVPTTATLHLTELKDIAIVSVSGRKALPYPIKVTSTSLVSLRVSNVRVNGVPLNVGPSCRTVSPITLVVIGRGFNTLPPKGYTVSTGGALLGTATIPPFTGCGVAENLDPLLTGSISGRGNFVELTQGKLCGPARPTLWACPPPAPKPQR